MDAVSSILCLVTGSAIPLLMIFLLIRRATRQLAVAGAYGDVSRRLGLEVDTRGLSLHGHLGAQRIWVGQVMVGHGPERRELCWGVLDHERPLALGLLLRRRGLSERLWRRARAPRVALPDLLDRAIEASGDDPHRVRTLLDAAAQEHLLKMLHRWRDVVVTDESVRVLLSQPLATAAELQELVDDLRGLSSALGSARAAVDPPDALTAVSAGLQAMARERDLDFHAEYPAAGGVLDGRRVYVGPVRTENNYTGILRLGFRPHRTLGLQVLPQTEPDGYWSVGQDIQVGDDAFDDAFVVKGYDPQAVRELLTPELRAALCALIASGARLEVDDVRMSLTGAPLDADELERLLKIAETAAGHIGW